MTSYPSSSERRCDDELDGDGGQLLQLSLNVEYCRSVCDEVALHASTGSSSSSSDRLNSTRHVPLNVLQIISPRSQRSPDTRGEFMERKRRKGTWIGKEREGMNVQSAGKGKERDE